MNPKTEYFSQLNYTLANEDTDLELAIVRKMGARHVLAVCGSGGRSLPLAAAGAESLTCLDLADEQLWLAALRLATILQLSFQEFCLFWGFPPCQPEADCAQRKKLFESLHLESSVHDFFQKLFQEQKWQGLIYVGGWERSIISVPKLLRPLFGRFYDRIFAFEDMASQVRYMNQKLDSFLWKLLPRLVLRVFGNAAYFNAKLYKGRFVRKNIPEGYFDFYRNAFRKMFATGLNRKNFFLQLVFLGRLKYPEGNPIEAQVEVFAAAKQSLLQTTRVRFVKASIFDFAARGEQAFDFVSLSDVPSYLEGELEREYLQALRPSLAPGAIVVSRCYLRVPEFTDLTGFDDVSSDFAEAINHEKMQMYRIFVFRYRG